MAAGWMKKGVRAAGSRVGGWGREVAKDGSAVTRGGADLTRAQVRSSGYVRMGGAGVGVGVGGMMMGGNSRNRSSGVQGINPRSLGGTTQ